jgi:hypothetical protein
MKLKRRQPHLAVAPYNVAHSAYSIFLPRLL